MTIRLVKIVSSMNQGDVKIGLPSIHGKAYKVPKELLRMLVPPTMSKRHEDAVAAGRGEDVLEALRQYGYLRFNIEEMTELGMLDPNYRNQKVKVCTLPFIPVNSNGETMTSTGYCLAINFLRQYIAKHEGAFPGAKVIVYDRDRPTLLTRDLTYEDVAVKKSKKDEKDEVDGN